MKHTIIDVLAVVGFVCFSGQVFLTLYVMHDLLKSYAEKTTKPASTVTR